MVRWRLNDVQNGIVRVDTKQLSSLIRQEPISRYYHVEQPPFAIGAFANVCRAHSLLDTGRDGGNGGTFAAKFCTRRRSGMDCTSEIHHEIALLSLCSASPRIVQLHDVFQTAEQFIIIMEYAPGGDMQTIIDNNVVPFEADVVRFVQHVIEALCYLHHRRVAHLDIKPQNLVLMGDFPHCDVKVCDFEISRVILDGSDIHEILGTPEYVAPEILHYEPITLAADMWSLGVTVYVLLTGFSPFGGETDQETFLNISRAQLDFPDELFDDVSDHAKDFIQKLLKRDPKERMTAKQCLRHPWLANNKTRRRHGNKTNSSTTPSSSSSNQLRKYLSKSREALFERVVAKHQQQQLKLQAGNRSRYDRTRRLCESQMSLVSRSREQLLLTGNKRCLSRDKLYGIRHLSKSHEVLNSLAGALVAQMDDKRTTKLAQGQETETTTDNEGRIESVTKDDAAQESTPLQTVLTLICDSKKNNNKETLRKENESKPRPTSSAPSTPETESSRVLIAIEKLEMAMNECNNNKSSNNKQLSQETENKNNSTITTDENKMVTTIKTADQTKTSTTTKTSDGNKMATTTKAADGNKVATMTTTSDKNKMSAMTTTADKSRVAHITKTDQNQIQTSKTTMAEQTKMAAITDDQTKMAAEPTNDENKASTIQDSITEKKRERPCLLFTKQTSTTSSVDLNSPVGGGGTSLSPTTDNANISSSEADVSEPDSNNSTWQRIEDDEPRFTVAQLISAFNKHQALVTKTSLEVTMSRRGGAPESKILPDEVSDHTANRKFPIGPDALRLFIPGISISETGHQKTQKSPTTPDVEPESMTKNKQEEFNVAQPNANKEKLRKIDKSGKSANPTYPTLDCSLSKGLDPIDFSPPTPPPPPPLSSEQTRNYNTRTARHRTSGRQATTLAASSKIRKKSNTTPKPPFY